MPNSSLNSHWREVYEGLDLEYPGGSYWGSCLLKYRSSDEERMWCGKWTYYSMGNHIPYDTEPQNTTCPSCLGKLWENKKHTEEKLKE